MTIALQLLLQVVLIVINAFFAATEIAVISLNANKLRKLEEEGDKLAPRLLKMVEAASRLFVHHPNRHHAGGLSGLRLCRRTASPSTWSRWFC